MDMPFPFGYQSGEALPVEHRWFKFLAEKGTNPLDRIFEVFHDVLVPHLKDLVGVGCTEEFPAPLGRPGPFEARALIISTPIQVDERDGHIATVTDKLDELRARK